MFKLIRIRNTYIHALRNAGEYKKASAYGWYFLQTLPNGFEDEKQFEKFPQNLAGSIRQAGLTVDAVRYPFIERNNSNSASKDSYSSNYRLQDKNRIESNPNWIALDEKTTPEMDTYQTLVKSLKEPNNNLEIQRHKVSLALEFGQLKTGSLILSHLEEPPIELVLQFSEIICDQYREFPLAVDKNVLELWLKAIHKVFKTSKYTDEQCFTIHAALKAQLFTAKFVPSTHLVEKLFDLQLTDEKAPLQYTETGNTEKSKYKPKHTQLLGKEHQAVYVSIVNMGDMISIAATDEEQFKSLISPLNIQVPNNSKLKTYLKVDENNKLIDGCSAVRGAGNVEYFIDFLKKTVKEALKLSNNLLSDMPAIIYLAPPTEWVGFPWQYLFYFAKECRDAGSWPVISIVPNLDWIFAARKYRCSKKYFKHRTSIDRDLKESVDRFEQLCRVYNDDVREQNEIYKKPQLKISQLSIIAHGLPPSEETPFATIAIPDSYRPFSIDDWLSDEVTGFEAYILHACSTGQVIPIFSGNDYGGAPGLILMLKGKVVLAPCVEINSEVALMLQAEIFEKSLIRGKTYTDVYRAAVAKDERVLFYTLFGLATLPLLV